MKIFFVLLFYFKFSHSQECGIPQVGTSFIAGGDYTEKGEWPWMASLMKLEREKYKFHGGASIISKRHLLTAAHCFHEKGRTNGLNPSEVYALIGHFELNNEAENRVKVYISKFSIHPDWKPSIDVVSHDADIAVALLENEISFNHLIQPVCLPQSNTNVFHVRGTVVGYGFSEIAEVSQKPKKVEISSSNFTCLFTEPLLAKIGSPRMFCGGSPGKNPCKGDSGGGFFTKINGKWTILGMVSAAISSECVDNKFVLFTNVPSHIEWITNAIKVPKTGYRTLKWDGELENNFEIFAFKLIAYLETLNSDDNLMIHPHLIHKILTLISEGASGNTFLELSNTLGLKNRQRNRDYQSYWELRSQRTQNFSKTFSALIGDQNRPFGREYINVVEQDYDTDYIPINFNNVQKSLKEIQSQSSQKTNGAINDKFYSTDEFSKSSLTALTASSFEGLWKYSFDQPTQRGVFYDYKLESPIKIVNMMVTKANFVHTFIEDMGADFIELPYAGENVYMIIALPKKNSEFYETINSMNFYSMERVFKELKNSQELSPERIVEVIMPRFEIKTSVNLVEVLENMGIKDIFEQTLADLSKINTNYFVSSFLHKTFIRVDEKGEKSSKGFDNAVFSLKINRPFLFLIVDKETRTIITTGVIKVP